MIKHIPGHGCASFDSHLKTPKVKLNYKDLIKMNLTDVFMAKMNQDKYE